MINKTVKFFSRSYFINLHRFISRASHKTIAFSTQTQKSAIFKAFNNISSLMSVYIIYFDNFISTTGQKQIIIFTEAAIVDFIMMVLYYLFYWVSENLVYNFFLVFHFVLCFGFIDILYRLRRLFKYFGSLFYLFFLLFKLLFLLF